MGHCQSDRICPSRGKWQKLALFFLKRQRLRRNSAPDLDYLGQQFQINLNLFHLDWKASSYARNCLDKAASLQGNGAGVPSLRTLLYWIPHKPLGVHISVTTSHPFWGQPKDFLQFLDPFCGKTFWLFLCLNRILYLVLINNALFFSRTLPAFLRVILSSFYVTQHACTFIRNIVHQLLDFFLFLNTFTILHKNRIGDVPVNSQEEDYKVQSNLNKQICVLLPVPSLFDTETLLCMSDINFTNLLIPLLLKIWNMSNP